MSGEPILSWEPFIMIIMFWMSLILPKLIVRHDSRCPSSPVISLQVYIDDEINVLSIVKINDIDIAVVINIFLSPLSQMVTY